MKGDRHRGASLRADGVDACIHLVVRHEFCQVFDFGRHQDFCGSKQLELRGSTLPSTLKQGIAVA